RGDPSVWIAVLGHWPTASRVVVEHVAPLARRASERLGVLLLAALQPGHVKHRSGADAERGEILPTLDAPELDGLIATVEQGVSVESARELARVLGDSARLSLAAIMRAARAPLALELDGVRVPARVDRVHLARLLTVDVLRAREAWQATGALE